MHILFGMGFFLLQITLCFLPNGKLNQARKLARQRQEQNLITYVWKGKEGSTLRVTSYN